MNILQIIINFITGIFKDKNNDGVIIEELKLTDYVMGEKTLIAPEVIVEDSDWEKYLSKPYDTQYVGFDQMDCTTQSGINCLEAQLNYMLMNNLLPKELDYAFEQFFCNKEGYVKLSTRFTAKMAGTTPQGLSMTAFWDSIRKHGFVPIIAWPDPKGTFNWNEYYKEIPQKVKDFAISVAKLFETKYEWVEYGRCLPPVIPKIREALKQAPLHVAAPSCPRDYAGIQRPCGTCVTNHCRTIYRVDDYINVLDHYNPFLRKTSIDYPATYIVKGVIKLKT